MDSGQDLIIMPGRSWDMTEGVDVTKQDWLFRLRKITAITTLEKVIERKEYSLSPSELVVFYSASDHRLAELSAGRLFDKVPRHIWKYVK